MSREPSLLTPDQREFLRGEKEYEHEGTESNTRYEIRGRIRDSLLDLALLAQELKPQDREQLFRDIRPLSSHPEDFGRNPEGFREDELGGLIGGIALFYAGTHDAGIPFEQIVELGILAAERREVAGPFAVGGVSVDIEADPRLGLEHLVDRVCADNTLSEAEYLALQKLAFTDRDRLLKATTSIDTGPEQAASSDGTLGLGRSVVLGARILDNPARHSSSEVASRLHNRVLTDLGLDQFY